jgi:hypothetical protein
MLRLTTNLLTKSFKASRVLMRGVTPSVGMCQAKPPAIQPTESASKLTQQLDEEIKYENENKPDTTDTLKNLEKNGWTVKTEGTMV